MPAGSRGVYRSGTWWPDTSLPPHQDAIDRALANLQRATDRYSIRQPVKWSTAVQPLPSLTREQLELYYGQPVRLVTGINPARWDASTFNERSKPMGLTKEHAYDSPRSNGRKLAIEASDLDEGGSYIKTDRHGEGEPTWISEADSIPLALNVLGYDRPKPGDGSSVSAGGFFAPGIRIQGDAQRAELVAKAISYLKSVDLYDQQATERKAAEEAAAKRKAEHEKRIAAKEVARVSLASAVEVARDFGVSPSRADELIAAAQDYKAAVAAVGAS